MKRHIQKGGIMNKYITIILIAGLATIWGTSASAANEYAVDPVHSSIQFKVKHFGVSYVSGRFDDIQGTLWIDEADPKNSTIDIRIKTKSVNTGNQKRDAHLRGPDFFDVEKYPEIRFTGQVDRQLSAETGIVKGTLTLHGVQKPFSVEIRRTGHGKDPWGGYRMGFETTFKVLRSDFNMKPMASVGDEVILDINLECLRK
jgi:polyisoprenoid-binding protein YceI